MCFNTPMNDFYDDYYAEPEGLDPFDEIHFYDEDEDEEMREDENRYQEAREDFGYFGEMGLWD